MPFGLLHERLPILAEAETRIITVLESSDVQLPPANYEFLERMGEDEFDGVT